MDPESRSVIVANSKKCFYFAELGLRILVIAFSVAGAVTTVTSDQTVSVFGISMSTSYTYSTAFRYKVAADSVVGGLTLLSVILVVSLNRPKSNIKNYFYLFLLDLVCVLVLLSACSASMAIGFVGKFGQKKSGWFKICDRVGKFCDKMTVSIATSFLAVICLLLLTVMSVYKLRAQPSLEAV